MAEQESKKQIKTNLTTNQPKKFYTGFIFGSINLVIVLLLMGLVYYSLQDLKDKQSNQELKISQNHAGELEISKQLVLHQTQLTVIKSKISAFNENMTGKDNRLTKALSDFSQLHTKKLENINAQLAEDIILLKRQLGKTREDWFIDDAEYLLSVANQRLNLTGDVKTSLLAMKHANQRLRASGNVAIFKVREQIAKEIDALKSVSIVDVVGVYYSIQSLQVKVAELTLLLPYVDKPLKSKNYAYDTQSELELGVFSAALNFLKDYIVIKHTKIPVTRIITKAEVEFIRQQLNVKLEMIKTTLLQYNDSLYKSNIEDTIRYIKSNFTINKLAKNFLTDLNKLNNIHIDRRFPDVSHSLKLLKDIIKSGVRADKS